MSGLHCVSGAMDSDTGIRSRSIDSLFSDIVSVMPSHPALLDGMRSVTYRSLDRKSNQFSRFLQRYGVLRGDFVVVLADRSISTVIALLGILRAGAAYVPLDAGDPPDRLARLLADCAPTLVLVQDSKTALPCAPGTQIVELGEALERCGEESDAATYRDANADDIACVMYTSGSTGQPKGVVVSHRGIVRLVRQQDYAPFGPAETMLHLAPLAFDASTFEIWGALLNGGRLAIVGAARPSLEDIADAVQRHQVSTAWFTAGLFALLVDHRLDALTPLRCIVAGGDVLSPTHVQRAYAGLPNCRIVNGYGPTENTTFTCCYAIPREGWGGGSVPIGSPIRGTRVHLLGPALTPVAAGEVGQICCAGDGLAYSYLNQHRLTAAKFVHIERDGAPAERVYLTGDLGRLRPDSAIEFCGRIDFQVKISGKRVELGDIENALRTDPDIEDAVVTARDGPSGTKRLAAYLKPREPWPPESTGTRSEAVTARLRRKLPDYMIPAEAIVVSEFPLTANGKVDRARLPVPADVSAPRRRDASRAGETEDAVAAIWQNVLGLQSVDRETNFFDLGGTSLLLMIVHERLVRTISPTLSIVTLFERTTIRSIAAALDRPAGFPAPRHGISDRGSSAPGTATSQGTAP